MSNSSELELTITIPFWVTLPEGFVVPYCYAEDSSSNEFHFAIPFDKQLGVGAKVKVREGSPVQFLKKLEASSEPLNQPGICGVCKSSLITKKDKPFCPSFDCSGKAHTSIFRLIGGCNEAIQNWIDHFPDQFGVQIEIKEIKEFLQHFSQVGPKGIQARMIRLKKQFGEKDGMFLWYIEKNLQDSLTRGVSFVDFWYITLPYLTLEECYSLRAVSPLTSCTVQKIKEANVSEKVLNLLINWQDHWIEIAQFLYSRDLIKI